MLDYTVIENFGSSNHSSSFDWPWCFGEILIEKSSVAIPYMREREKKMNCVNFSRTKPLCAMLIFEIFWLVLLLWDALFDFLCDVKLLLTHTCFGFDDVVPYNLYQHLFAFINRKR